MEFGRVRKDELDNVDFALPQYNNGILNGNKSASFKIHIGLPRWNNPEWKGKLYTSHAKDAALLPYYAESYDCIELNATWYKIPSLQNIHSWKNSVKGNKEFLFCPKMVKEVTHSDSLAANKNISDAFIDTVRNLDNNLGPVFIQLHESFSPSRKNDLFSYLKTLPEDILFFLEVRHPQWFADTGSTEELFSFLQDHNIGAVITDAAGRRDAVHMQLTIPKAFIRFTGNGLHPSDYTRIDDWVNRIKLWMDNGIEEIFFFIHMPDELLAPELSSYLINTLNEKCGLEIRKPRLKDDSSGQLSLF